jgi:hypothetical protein
MKLRSQVQGVLYRLKRDYGKPMEIRNLALSEAHRASGAITTGFQILKIQKGILLPARMVPSFVYDLAFIAANKNFTYGGFFGASTRTVIVDGRDLPKNFEVKESSQLIIESSPYSIKNVEKLVERLGLLLAVTTLSNLES